MHFLDPYVTTISHPFFPIPPYDTELINGTWHGHGGLIESMQLIFSTQAMVKSISVDNITNPARQQSLPIKPWEGESPSTLRT